MPALTSILTAVGVAAGAAGTVGQMMASSAASDAQKKQIAASQVAERARQQQMDLESQRKKRDMIRTAQVARATATSNAVNQGGEYGSGLAGGIGSIEGQTGVNVSGVSQNQELGNRVFAANAAGAAAQSQAADAASLSATMGGISSLGGAVVKNAGTIGKIGTNFGL